MSSDLGYAKYISVTTYRRSGVPVATPVWAVPIGEKIYVSTGDKTGKVKRLRNNEHAVVSLSDARGRNLGPEHKATVRIVPFAEHPEILELMRHKYGIQQRVVEVLDKVRNRTKRPIGERVLLELTIEE